MFDADLLAGIPQMNTELDADGSDFLPPLRSRARCRSRIVWGREIRRRSPCRLPVPWPRRVGRRVRCAPYAAERPRPSQGRCRSCSPSRVSIRSTRPRRRSRSIELGTDRSTKIRSPPSADRYLRHDPERQHQDRDRCDPGAQDARHHDLCIAAQAK